ncbi:protransforming growth factor alpha isoform X1 [Myotis daubentonii]|nr:protransforming growth factor alpha isoform X1 [Myotis daubentonii]
MFLEGLHRARLSKHNQGCRRSGHLGLRRLAVRGLDVHILAPQETLLAEGELEAMEIPKRQRMWPLEERAPASMPDLLNLSFGLISEAVTGLVLAVCQALENTTSALSANPPMAAAVVSYFNDCPDSHSQFCFHGTCRFLVQEDKPACVCHSGYVGARCEHADLLAVVAASQKKQAITALVVVSVVALAGLIITCVLIHCCQVRKYCEWCRALICRHEKPSALLKGRPACCHSETVV